MMVNKAPKITTHLENVLTSITFRVRGCDERIITERVSNCREQAITLIENAARPLG
jgi:hypothetical protein